MSADARVAADAGVRLDGVRLALFTDTYPPQLNGVARTLERLTRAAEARGAEVRVITTSDPAAGAEPSQIVRWPSRPFWAYPQLQLAAPRILRARQMLADWRPTLVHVATEFGVGLAGRQAARALRLPLVSSYHTSFSAYAQFYRLGALAGAGWQYFRWFHGGALRTFVPTEAIRDEVESHRFRNVRVWSRGVDGDRFDPRFRSLEWRRSIGVADDTVLVLYVGRIAKEKGLPLLLHAMQNLAGESPSTQVAFVIVGDGPYEAEMRAAAPGSVHFTGRLSGVPLSTAYASADAFVFPSITDTFGNVLLEAMASGLVVLAADAGNTREIVGETRGVMIPPDDSAALTTAVRQLATSPERAHAMRTTAATWARARTWDAVWNQLFAEYRSLGESGSASGRL
jgi:phosphatidylinositol alpha 1,6-mannosyltransferase